MLYMDETTWSLWQRQLKTWQKPTEPIPTVKNDTMLTLTIYGALSNFMDRPVYYTATSTNIEDTKQFFLKLERLIPAHVKSKGISVILDNHSAHKSEKFLTSSVMTKGIFRVFNQPTYSCEVNPVESLWSSLKRQLQIFYARTQKQYKSLRIFNKCLNEQLDIHRSKTTVTPYLRVIRPFIERYLPDDQVPFWNIEHNQQ